VAIEPYRNSDGAGLADVIDRILDKGLVINADIAVSLAGGERTAAYDPECPGHRSPESANWAGQPSQKDWQHCPGRDGSGSRAERDPSNAANAPGDG